MGGFVYTEEMDESIQKVLTAGEYMRESKIMLDDIVSKMEESISWTGDSKNQLVAFLKLMQNYLNTLCDGDDSPISQMERELLSFLGTMEDYESNSEAIAYAKGVQ